jgi:hypothetical protein
MKTAIRILYATPVSLASVCFANPTLLHQRGDQRSTGAVIVPL